MAKSYVVKTGGATHKFSSAAKASAFRTARAGPVLAGGGGGGSPAPAPTVSRPGQYQVRTPAGDIFSFQTQAEAQAFQARRTDIGATSLTTRAGVPIPKEPMVTITAVSTPEMRSGAPERDIIKGQVQVTPVDTRKDTAIERVFSGIPVDSPFRKYVVSSYEDSPFQRFQSGEVIGKPKKEPVVKPRLTPGPTSVLTTTEALGLPKSTPEKFKVIREEKIPVGEDLSGGMVSKALIQNISTGEVTETVFGKGTPPGLGQPAISGTPFDLGQYLSIKDIEKDPSAVSRAAKQAINVPIGLLSIPTAVIKTGQEAYALEKTDKFAGVQSGLIGLGKFKGEKIFTGLQETIITGVEDPARGLGMVGGAILTGRLIGATGTRLKSAFTLDDPLTLTIGKSDVIFTGKTGRGQTAAIAQKGKQQFLIGQKSILEDFGLGKVGSTSDIMIQRISKGKLKGKPSYKVGQSFGEILGQREGFNVFKISGEIGKKGKNVLIETGGQQLELIGANVPKFESAFTGGGIGKTIIKGKGYETIVSAGKTFEVGKGGVLGSQTVFGNIANFWKKMGTGDFSGAFGGKVKTVTKVKPGIPSTELGKIIGKAEITQVAKGIVKETKVIPYVSSVKTVVGTGGAGAVASMGDFKFRQPKVYQTTQQDKMSSFQTPMTISLPSLTTLETKQKDITPFKPIQLPKQKLGITPILGGGTLPIFKTGIKPAIKPIVSPIQIPIQKEKTKLRIEPIIKPITKAKTKSIYDIGFQPPAFQTPRGGLFPIFPLPIFPMGAGGKRGRRRKIGRKVSKLFVPSLGGLETGKFRGPLKAGEIFTGFGIRKPVKKKKKKKVRRKSKR